MGRKICEVSVFTKETELKFVVKGSMTGKELFDRVTSAIGVREIWYFGLMYTTTKNESKWINFKKKLLDQDGLKTDERPLKILFLIKYYPEDVSQEIFQDITLRLFYLQVKADILSDAIYCPAVTSVMLASYAMQELYGDFDDQKSTTGFLQDSDIVHLLPQRVIDQHKNSLQQWEQILLSCWKDHSGMLCEEAMMEYLKLAQDLEMYGITYFKIHNKKGTNLWLGVDALGLNVYESDDKLTPKVSFPWWEVRNLTYSNKKFVIKPINRKEPNFECHVPSFIMNKQIVKLCMGNHEQYMQRRKPDTIEVQQMKIQAMKEKQAKQQQREKLQLALAARERAEKQQKETEERLNIMQQEVEKTRKDVQEAQQLIARYDKQLKETTALKQSVQQRLEEMTTLLERHVSENIEKEELEEKMRITNEEKQRLQEEVNALISETKYLQDKVEEARSKQAEAANALVTASVQTLKDIHVSDSEDDTEVDAETACGDKIREEELGSDDGAVGGANADVSHDLEIDEKIDDAIKDRQTLIEHNKRLHVQLQTIQENLALSCNQEKETDYDKIHRENMRQGRDKYVTLRFIRRGNTKRRIDEFENM